MPKVLIADDESDSVANIVDYLRRRGWDLSSAPNGKEALEVLDDSFDAVVLDLRMPVMDGETTFNEIKKRPHLGHLCVVVLTAYGEVEGAVRIIRRGAYQYLQKPFRSEDLMRILISGIAWQKAHVLRGSILKCFNAEQVLRHIRLVVAGTLHPDRMDIMLLGSEGQVIGGEPVDIVGSRDGGRKFARHVVKSKQPLLVHNDTAAWQAVLPNARSLLVVPIPGRDDTVSGVIHIESVGEAVDESWIDVLQYLADLTGIGLEIAEEVDQQFRRVQSMVDELSHHISTPLQVIKLQVQTLASKELEGELPQSIASRVRDRLKAIERNADAIAEVRDYLRDVSRDLKVHKTEVDLLEVLDACRQEFEGELKEKHIVLTVPDRLTQELLIEADPNLIRYSFQCLLQNAIEAIDERRKRDTPGATTAAGDCITITIELSDPERVLVGIKDTGVGIAPEKRNRLFEPLFTTKKLNGRGGMGLFSVRRVLNMHGGSIIERSTPGEGADFIVTLPRK